MLRTSFIPMAWTLVLLSGCSSRLAAQHGAAAIPPMVPAGADPAVLWSERFGLLDPNRWRQVSVRGYTDYDVVELEGRSCLRAKSQGTASILVTPVRFNPDTYEWLSWSWRVDRLVAEEHLERKDGSDAAARVYVYVESRGLPWQKRNLDYVWSATLPIGTILESAYTAESKIIVVESGPEHLGRWRRVTRNIEDDYKRCFGTRPPQVIALGLMSDADNTRGESLAYFDDVAVSRSPESLPLQAP